MGRHHFQFEGNTVVTPPVTLRENFASILIKARPFLTGKTQAEINSMCQFLSDLDKIGCTEISPNIWLNLSPDKNHRSVHWMRPVKLNLNDVGSRKFLISAHEVDELRFQMGKIQIDQIKAYGKLDWPTLFATLSVSYVSKAAEFEEYQHGLVARNQITLEELEGWLYSDLEEFIFLAEQAIEVALNLEARTREKRNHASGIAKARHDAKTGKLKELVLNRYKNYHTNRSNRDAAKRIFAELCQEGILEFDQMGVKVSQDGNVILQTDDPEKRFEIWIGQSKKKPKQI